MSTFMSVFSSVAFWSRWLSSLEIKVPFSGGSSLEGNFSAPYGGMSIDMVFMDKIVEFHEDEYVTLWKNCRAKSCPYVC